MTTLWPSTHENPPKNLIYSVRHICKKMSLRLILKRVFMSIICSCQWCPAISWMCMHEINIFVMIIAPAAVATQAPLFWFTMYSPEVFPHKSCYCSSFISTRRCLRRRVKKKRLCISDDNYATWRKRSGWVHVDNECLGSLVFSNAIKCSAGVASWLIYIVYQREHNQTGSVIL